MLHQFQKLDDIRENDFYNRQLGLAECDRVFLAINTLGKKLALYNKDGLLFDYNTSVLTLFCSWM